MFDWGYIGAMEKKMESTIVYWDYMRIMEKKMETTVMGYIGVIWWFPKIGGPHYRPQNTTILIIRTPKKGTPNFGKPL